MSMIWNAAALTPSELTEISKAPDPFKALRALPEDRWSGLDKAWDAAHWLITGGTEAVVGPDGFIKSGGRAVDAIEASYGPGRYFDPKQASGIRDILLGLTRGKLASRWDPEAVGEDQLYPFALTGPRDGDLDFVLEHLDELRDFLAGLDIKTFGLLVFLD